MTLRDVTDFDLEHKDALKRIWLLGDVHGHFDHIGRTLQVAKNSSNLPNWLVFLGDMDLAGQTFEQVIQPFQDVCPGVKTAFIHGNHDADTYEKWTLLHESGPAEVLHGKVLDLDGVRVAGLGGNFLGRVWIPPAEPILRNKIAAMNRGPYQGRNGLQPSPKFHAAIYSDDVVKLGKQRADILVTHEAFSCHIHGWSALDQLARDLRVVRAFHGHTHDDHSDAYALQRDVMGFEVRAVNYCCIKNGSGEMVFELARSYF